jgi:hypothetical protein
MGFIPLKLMTKLTIQLLVNINDDSIIPFWEIIFFIFFS